MTGLKKLADPASFGPGAWLVIHTMAFDAKTNQKKKHFEESMHVIQKGLKCENCKVHCGEYLKKHPISDYWDIHDKNGEDIGMFKWSWVFHNTVNARLGKPIMDWDTAYHLYSNSGNVVCTKNCGDKESHFPKSPYNHNFQQYHSHHNPSMRMKDLSNRQPNLIRLIPTRSIIRSRRYR